MTDTKQVELVEYEVVADELWHSTDCRKYPKGAIVKLPAGLKLTDESSVRLKAPDKKAATDKKSGPEA